MRYFLLFFSLFLIKLFWGNFLYAFNIKNIEVYQSPEGSPVVNVVFNNFPSQEILLSLKRQKEEVLILYEFDILREGFLGSELLHKEVYYQRVGYLPEENLYYFEDNFERSFFTKPEDLLPKISFLASYPLQNFSLIRAKRGTILLVTVNIKFSTHLNKELRYTPEARKVIYKASKKYVFP